MLRRRRGRLSRGARRDAKRPTFSAARAELLAYLRTHGWDVKTSGPSGPLKTPHATSPSGSLRLWFKPQAVYFTTGGRHAMGGARSLWIDIREVSPAAIVAQSAKWEPGLSSRDARARRHARRGQVFRDPAARITSSQLAPQRFRDRVRELQREHADAYASRGARPIDPRDQLRKIQPLIRQARTLVWTHDRRRLDDIDESYRRANEAIRSGSTYRNLEPGYVLNALGRLTLRPAFKEGDRTSRGVVENVGSPSPSDGWLYGVRDERGVIDRVWESTLVWPALHGSRAPTRRARRKR